MSDTAKQEATGNDAAPRDPVDPLKSMSVLYVEDDDMVREQMECFMRRRVGTLHSARDGQEGLDLWRRHRPDIVVTDIMMPVMDGLKMAAEIRREHHTVPIVVTTAYNEANHFLRAIDIGIDKYVVKPIDGDRLERALVKCAREVRANLDLKLAATVFDTSSSAILVTDARSRIVAVNAAFTEITGHARAEVLGRTPALLASGLHGAAFYTEMYDKLASAGSWAGEVHNRHKNGEIYTEWLTINVVRDAGVITHYVAIFTDITQRKENERMLLEAKRAAEAANLAKSQFLATMSHEIRTPMNGILGMAQLLLMPALQDDERLECARAIMTSGQTLLAILNDILDLSKIDAGKMELMVTAFDPRQLIEETTALFAETARNKGLSLTAVWTTGPAVPRYWGDPLRLRQMLSNLLTNAIKFTESGGIRVMAWETHDGMIEFAVSDTGIGIAPEQRDKLFKPFSQVDGSATRRYGGTGLGLSIVSSLADLMGGDVGVDSVANQGSTFRFRIRAQRARDDAEARPAARETPPEKPPIDLSAPARPCRILVAEDNPTNRLVIEAILGKCGYTFLSVENGRAAVDAIVRDNENADLILMDCQMPMMNGFEATEQIRAWETARNRPRLPIVALTASAFQEDRTHCLAVGMDDFLTKPIDVRQLQATLQKWLEPEKPASAVPPAPIF